MNKRLRISLLTRKIHFLLILVLIMISYRAYGSDWSFGIKGGFGGTGIVKTAIANDESVAVNRSEGPLVGGISGEKIIAQRWSLGIEHRRGLRLGPFSSGVGFTDATWRWFYYGIPAKVLAPKSINTVFNKSISYFVGPSVGLAFGTITREGDQVESISSSGLTIGVKIGMDYKYLPNLILRPEISTATTLLSEGAITASMSEFSLLLGLIFPLSVFY